MYFFVKTLITALVVAAVSELTRRYSLIAAALVSLPLTSILAFIWVYQDSKDTAKIIELSQSILWLVLPSAVFFVILPILLRMHLGFYLSLVLSCAIMAGAYGLFIWAKKLMGV